MPAAYLKLLLIHCSHGSKALLNIRTFWYNKRFAMKRFFTLPLIFAVIIFCGCSKDFLKRYDKRIVGTWRISDVDRFGIGGNSDNLSFHDGNFNFRDDGSLTFTDGQNNVFEGTWDIVKKTINEETVRSLHVTAVNYANQEVLSEYYDDMNFLSTNHFKANILRRTHRYVTHFRR